MTNLNNKIVAIIPARNEEKTIGNVLKVIKDANRFDEIIVIDGASSDKTVEISEKNGARVFRSKTREGKGMAMKSALKITDAGMFVFFDADLIGLNQKHIDLLLNTFIEKNLDMVTGERGRWMYLPYIIARIDNMLAIGGERAMKRSVLENVPDKFIHNFAIETALNYYCKVNKLKYELVVLDELDIVPKEIKWGVINGFWERLNEVWQIIKIRITIIFKKNEFIQKN